VFVGVFSVWRGRGWREEGREGGSEGAVCEVDADESVVEFGCAHGCGGCVWGANEKVDVGGGLECDEVEG